jgi:hypothetical protein
MRTVNETRWCGDTYDFGGPLLLVLVLGACFQYW